MSDTDIPRKRARTSVLNECRACLVKIQDGLGCVDIFRAWDPSWSGMGASIALDLVKLSNIQISASDPHSKNICKTCCTRLQEALHFTLSVQKNDLILRKRHKESKDENPLWPKPIQVDKNITTNELNVMTAEVKEEVLTEDEYEMNETCNEASEPNLDIKIEPEELTPVAISCDAIKVDGPLSDPDPAAGNTANANSATEAPVEHLVEDVKEEPMSEDESEPVADMPKDCMLCLESFNTVKGLKAHVIAVHSYKSFASPRVEKLNVCTKCNRSFTTRAELSMHEVCHNNFKCYVCHKKLDTFLLLIEHRDKCEQEQNLSELETLEDVRRPLYFVSDKISSKISEEGQTPESHNDLISKVTGGKEAPNSVGTRSALEPQDLGNYEIIEEDIPLELSVSGHSTVNEKPTIEELTSKLNVISEGSHESNKATEKEPENMSYSKKRNSNLNKNLDTFKPEENTQSSQKPVDIDTAVIVDFKSQQAEDIKQEEYVDVAQDDELTLESNSSNNNIDDDKSEVCYKIRENGSEVSNITKEYEVKDNNNQKENESEAEIKICVVIDSINHIKSEERRISEDSKLTLELPLKIEENLLESTTIDNITSKSSNIGPEVCKTKGSITATLETILNQDLENKREENLLQSLENANIKNETDEQTDMNDMKQSPSNKDLKSLLSEMQVDNLESMKIELEIHSMDKDTMEIDGDLENGIKASSESDKQT